MPNILEPSFDTFLLFRTQFVPNRLLHSSLLIGYQIQKEKKKPTKLSSVLQNWMEKIFKTKYDHTFVLKRKRKIIGIKIKAISLHLFRVECIVSWSIVLLYSEAVEKIEKAAIKLVQHRTQFRNQKQQLH